MTIGIPKSKADTCSLFDDCIIIATTDGKEYKCLSYEIIGETMYLHGTETEIADKAKESKAYEQAKKELKGILEVEE